MDPWADWVEPVAHTSTLDRVGWSEELIRGNLEKTVRRPKQERGREIGAGGVMLRLALAELDRIDEYGFVVQLRIAAHGPTLVARLAKPCGPEARRPPGAGPSGSGDAA